MMAWARMAVEMDRSRGTQYFGSRNDNTHEGREKGV